MITLNRHLYLTGYRGSGKSSVGKRLGTHLQCPVIDLDDRIEAAAGRSIREIFIDEGEQGFRDRESAELETASRESASVISLGGGAIMREQNRAIIAATGDCVWLKIDVDTAMKRLAGDSTTADRRPALTHLPAREEIADVLASREATYASVASMHVDVCNRTVSEIETEILAWLRSEIGDPSGPTQASG